MSLARLQERQGDLVAARSVYEQVLKAQPDHQLAHHRLGVLDARDGKYETAIAHFEIATSAGDPSAELLNDLGYACYLQGELPDAEMWLRKAVTADARNLAAHNNLGLVLGAMGRDDESLSEFRLAGSMADAYNNLAWVKSQNGDIKAARQHYLRALDADSTLKPAAQALVALGNHEQALNRIAKRGTPKLAPAIVQTKKPSINVPVPKQIQLAGHKQQKPARADRSKQEVVNATGYAPVSNRVETAIHSVEQFTRRKAARPQTATTPQETRRPNIVDIPVPIQPRATTAPPSELQATVQPKQTRSDDFSLNDIDASWSPTDQPEQRPTITSPPDPQRTSGPPVDSIDDFDMFEPTEVRFEEAPEPRQTQKPRLPRVTQASVEFESPAGTALPDHEVISEDSFWSYARDYESGRNSATPQAETPEQAPRELKLPANVAPQSDAMPVKARTPSKLRSNAPKMLDWPEFQ